MMPFQIVSMWLRGLLAVAFIALGSFLLREWHQRSQVWEPAAQLSGDPRSTLDLRDGVSRDGGRGRRAFKFDPGWNAATAILVCGVTSLFLPLGSGLLVARFVLGRGARGGADDDSNASRDGTPAFVDQAGPAVGGARLAVESCGLGEGVPVVLMHGLGADGTQWYYAKRELGASCRVTVWDHAGVGRSGPPRRDGHIPAKLAADLREVARFASGQSGGRPVFLVGHSMGGMAVLEFCRRFPEDLGTLVAGLVLVGTTYTNPLRTTRHAKLYEALERPLMVPLLHLTVWLSPLVRALMTLSYPDGTAHLSTRRSGFAGT